MKEAYAKASEMANKTASRGKQHYDQKCRSTVLQPRDRVLVRNVTPRGGPGKLRSYWEDDVHVVLSRKSEDSPVYVVRYEHDKKQPRTLHRNMLLPCDYLPSEVQQPVVRKKSETSQSLKIELHQIILIIMNDNLKSKTMHKRMCKRRT